MISSGAGKIFELLHNLILNKHLIENFKSLLKKRINLFCAIFPQNTLPVKHGIAYKEK